MNRLLLRCRARVVALTQTGAPGRPKRGSGITLESLVGGSPFGRTPDAQAAMFSLVGCSALIGGVYWRGGPQRRTRRRTPIPATLSRRGCPTATAGKNAAAARITAAHRIGHQRVKPAARLATDSEAPADLGTWSTAVDRKRTLAACRDPQIGQSDHAQQPSCWCAASAREC